MTNDERIRWNFKLFSAMNAAHDYYLINRTYERAMLYYAVLRMWRTLAIPAQKP